jgi:hypothetical protein
VDGGSESLLLAAAGFRVDGVTAEATRALEAASIPSILLKGPAIATWLYPRGENRFYVDTDLLVRRGDWRRAMTVLESLGFEDDLGPLAHPRMESAAGHPWTRAADGAAVDLHCSIYGVAAAPEAVWDVFSADAVSGRVGGTVVSMPSHAARLLHIALHAVQHGGGAYPQPMKDLALAVSRAPAGEWRDAWVLARRLQAGPAFAAGLCLLPEGAELADSIGAERQESTATSLRIEGVPMAEGFQHLTELRGLRAKLALALREMFPNPSFMRWWTSVARRGAVGLVAAYCWRLLWLGLHAVPGYRAWRRAR